MLDPLDLEAAARLHEQVEQRLQSVLRATAPIYRKEDGEPVSNGSAVLFRVGAFRFALTAAHVVDKSKSFPLYLGSSDKPVLLEGAKTATKLKEGQSRHDDDLDVAVLLLHSATAKHLSDEDFIEATQLDSDNRNLDDQTFLVAGYPGTKRRKHPAQGMLEVGLYPFLARSRTADGYERSHLDPARHLLLGFSKKRLWRRGVRVIAPNLHEMSGCGIWSIKDATGALFERPRLAALLTEWRRHSRPEIVATRMNVVLAGVHSALLKLRDDTEASP